MKHFIFITVILLICQVAYCQSHPSAEQIREWADFPKDFALNVKQITMGDYTQWGQPKWIFSYSNEERSLEGFIIALYEPGSLWAENRDKFVKVIEEQVEKGKNLSEYFRKNGHIDDRPGGRKAYFTVFGVGPGGSATAGFTFYPKHDLLVVHTFIGHDGLPSGKMIENPVVSRSDLADIFFKVEQYLGTQRKE